LTRQSVKSTGAFAGLRQRALTALYYGPVSLLAIYLGPYSTLALLLMLAFFTGREFEAITNLRKTHSKHLLNSFLGWLCFAGVLVPSILFLLAPDGLAVASFICAGFLYILWLNIRLMKALPIFSGQNRILSSLGYIAIPLSLFYWIGLHQAIFNYKWLFALLSLIWGNDTIAYFSGKNWGRRPLASSISPNKTWEGAIGGWLACIIIALVWSIYWDALNTTEWLVFGVLTGPACTLGDLIESKFKRELNLKDSGTSFPGHGGFLDRLDSLLFSAPIVAFYLWMV